MEKLLKLVVKAGLELNELCVISLAALLTIGPLYFISLPIPVACIPIQFLSNTIAIILNQETFKSGETRSSLKIKC